MKAIALLVLALFTASAFAAELYRWVDDKGVVNYTPFPPPALSDSKLPEANRTRTSG